MPQTRATDSLVTSLCGLGVLGVIFGHISLSQIKRDPDTLLGRGMAIAGVVIGYVTIAFWLFFILAIAAAPPNPVPIWAGDRVQLRGDPAPAFTVSEIAGVNAEVLWIERSEFHSQWVPLIALERCQDQGRAD
ncbi:MAG: DUF4190 domain-containing protein [Acidimicrobiaceae bacterium]|nr:DUF4190 domain-containing protein [Acidimicrobiaceae bacterium]